MTRFAASACRAPTGAAPATPAAVNIRNLLGSADIGQIFCHNNGWVWARRAPRLWHEAVPVGAPSRGASQGTGVTAASESGPVTVRVSSDSGSSLPAGCRGRASGGGGRLGELDGPDPSRHRRRRRFRQARARCGANDRGSLTRPMAPRRSVLGGCRFPFCWRRRPEKKAPSFSKKSSLPRPGSLLLSLFLALAPSSSASSPYLCGCGY